MTTPKFEPKRKVEHSNIQVRVPSEQQKLLKSLARHLDCNISEILRYGIQWAIDDLNGKHQQPNPDETPRGIQPVQIFNYDSQTLARSVMDLVELEASRRTGSNNYPQGPYLFKEEADSLVPGFNQTLLEAIAQHQVAEELEDRMHDEVNRLAQEIIQEMPQEQFESLVQAAETHIRSAVNTA